MRYAPLKIKSTQPTKKLFEMPQYVSGTDFGMGDPGTNRIYYEAFSAELHRNDAHIYEQCMKFILMGIMKGNKGHIALLDTSCQHVDYAVKYEINDDPIIGTSVTQVMLWKDGATEYPGSITRRVFFDILIPSFETIVSDRKQTVEGRNFWIARMAEAKSHGLSIGFTDDTSLTMYDPNVNLRGWIASQDGWGDEERYKDRRFLISRLSRQTFAQRTAH